jgi:hypothetical protein
MKVVMYHADAWKTQKFEPDAYKKLTVGFKKNLEMFGIELIHLTSNGHEGWGHTNYFYDVDPELINYSREICFVDFIKNTAKEDEIYLFTEPDHRLVELFPPLDGDLALLYRTGDFCPVPPSWRLARKSATPIFEEIFEVYNRTVTNEYNPLVWGGDSDAMKTLWERMGQPAFGKTVYNNLNIDFRVYKEYATKKSKYTKQYKAGNKSIILAEENK